MAFFFCVDDSEVTEESETEDPDEPDEQNGPTEAATSNGPRGNRNKKIPQIWRRKDPDEIPTINVPFTGKLYEGQPVKEPIQYFRDILDDKILSNIVVESNRYALQCDINRPLDVNEKEIEQFFGIILLMCIVKMSCSRMYWDREMRYDKVAAVMSRRRFETIKKNLHVVDNEKRPENCSDKLF